MDAVLHESLIKSNSNTTLFCWTQQENWENTKKQRIFGTVVAFKTVGGFLVFLGRNVFFKKPTFSEEKCGFWKAQSQKTQTFSWKNVVAS